MSNDVRPNRPSVSNHLWIPILGSDILCHSQYALPQVGPRARYRPCKGVVIIIGDGNSITLTIIWINITIVIVIILLGFEKSISYPSGIVTPIPLGSHHYLVTDSYSPS